jgi:hypothetical protein
MNDMNDTCPMCLTKTLEHHPDDDFDPRHDYCSTCGYRSDEYRDSVENIALRRAIRVLQERVKEKESED